MTSKAIVLAAFLIGVGGGFLVSRMGEWSSPAQAQDKAKRPVASLESLQDEIERLKKIVPDQAHAMQDVDYHFTNLWFAAQQGNWPLAKFYLNETRSHLRWAVRINPVRKDTPGIRSSWRTSCKPSRTRRSSNWRMQSRRKTGRRPLPPTSSR